MEMKEEKYYLKPNLKNFLIENGAYEEFIRNLMSYGNVFSIEKVNSSKGLVCFASAFVWKNTPEKHKYWSDLADKFDKIDN